MYRYSLALTVNIHTDSSVYYHNYMYPNKNLSFVELIGKLHVLIHVFILILLIDIIFHLLIDL